MKLIENTDGLDIDIISGKFDDDFSDLVFNTKNVVKDCLFVCIKGRNFDTHDVIDEIVKLGAKAVVVESIEGFERRDMSQFNYIKNVIRDNLKAFLLEKTGRNPMILPIVLD